MNRPLVIMLCLSAWFSSARPPEDLILLPPARKKGMRVLRNKNITFTNEQPEERGGKGLVKTRYPVKGRSRPDRTGKVLSEIRAQSIVTPFRWSRDGKWVAVIVRTSGIRVWIPKSSIPPLDNKFRLLKEEKDMVNGKIPSMKDTEEVDDF